MSRLVAYARRAHETLNERRLGISTAEWHSQHDAGRPDFRGYAPTAYRDWRVIRPQIHVSANSSFIDYGAGLGRVTALAARLPFKRVIGVELVRALVDRGNENLRNARGLRASAEIVCADATTFEIPTDAKTLFFCNPFTGSVLSAVLDRIRESLAAHPRSVQLVCNLPKASAFEHEIKAVPWLCLRETFALSDQRKCLIFEAGRLHGGLLTTP